MVKVQIDKQLWGQQRLKRIAAEAGRQELCVA